MSRPIGTPVASLAWTQDGAAVTAWLAASAACTPSGNVGDTGADDGPVEDVLSGWSADRVADAEENRRWRQWP